jgi:hypothetical protein
LKIFADNDIIIKLAALDLLEPFQTLFLNDNADFACLPSLAYQLSKRLPEVNAQARAINFVSSCRKLNQTYLAELGIDLDCQDLLATCPGVDSGEAQLFLAALASPGAVVLTGDKRCLSALYQSSAAIPLVPKLQGRVLILEQLILHMIMTVGFDVVKRRLMNGVYCDTAIRTAFGSGLQAKESNVILTLRSYVGEIDRCCPCLLASLDVLNGLL